MRTQAPSLKVRAGTGRVAALVCAAVIVCAGLVGGATASTASGKVSAKIVGGDTTTIAEWPWTAGLVVSSAHGGGNDFQRLLCGGSLISPWVVLTAAHCAVNGVVNQNPDYLQVVTGRTVLSGTDGQRADVSSITVDPGYVPSTLQNDVALLGLSSKSTQPTIAIAGPTEGAQWAAPSPAWVIGWGATSFNGAASDTLRQVQIQMISDATCGGGAVYGAAFDVNSMVCAGAADKDSCQGDSGGPLVVGDGGTGYRQVGVVSWGQGCADPVFPGVYSRIAEYGPGSLGQWIADTVPQIPAPPDPPPDVPPAIPETQPTDPSPRTACTDARHLRAKRKRAARSARRAVRNATTSRVRRNALHRLRTVERRLARSKRATRAACA